MYERLGRCEGSPRITADLVKNHLAKPAVKTRHENSEHLGRVERRVFEFFCAGPGGPETYSGQDMASTHKGTNISEQEFVAVIDDAVAALAQDGIDEPTRNDVLAILWSLKPEVIRL